LNNIRNVEIGRNQRNVQLDFLRGVVAVLMVVLHHTVIFRPQGWQAPLIRSGGNWRRFILRPSAGFLISGLPVFRVPARSGKKSAFWRFAGRRAFLKDLSGFLCTGLIDDCYSNLSGETTTMLRGVGGCWRAFLHDCLFVQSYFPRNVWTLLVAFSVEEHFYILLPLTL